MSKKRILELCAKTKYIDVFTALQVARAVGDDKVIRVLEEEAAKMLTEDERGMEEFGF